MVRKDKRWFLAETYCTPFCECCLSSHFTHISDQICYISALNQYEYNPQVEEIWGIMYLVVCVCACVCGCVWVCVGGGWGWGWGEAVVGWGWGGGGGGGGGFVTLTPCSQVALYGFMDIWVAPNHHLNHCWLIIKEVCGIHLRWEFHWRDSNN